MALRAAKKLAERALRGAPPLYRFGSRAYHRLLYRSFRTLSPGAPEAIRRAFALARQGAGGAEVGDYYEFGVYRGFTFLSAQRACDALGLAATRLYGFDSFCGLPPVGDQAREQERFFAGQFSCSRRQVVRNLERRGMDWSRAELVAGFFDDSLTDELKRRLPLRPAAVALFDCDLYSSTRAALRWLGELVVPGTVLLFDDWSVLGGSAEEGQPLAFAEFLREQPHLQASELGTFAHHGKTFVLAAA
jgi:O-methyltransferase